MKGLPVMIAAFVTGWTMLAGLVFVLAPAYRLPAALVLAIGIPISIWIAGRIDAEE